MHVAAIIAAGGRGVRFGADRPKQFLDIGGRSILELSVAALAASDRIQEIVVALPDDHVDAGAKALRSAIGRPITVVAGGARRQDSVANAFAKTSKDADIVADSRCGAAVRDARRDRSRHRWRASVMARRLRRSACATPSSRPATPSPTARA